MDHDGPSTIDLTQDAEYGAPCLLVKPAAEPLPIFAKVEDPFASQFGRQERTRRAKRACQKTKPWYDMSHHGGTNAKGRTTALREVGRLLSG
jgi:hypothetical protein